MKNHPTSRRIWLQQGVVAFARLTMAPQWLLEAQRSVWFDTDNAPIQLGSNENPYAPSPAA